ncbi:nuclear pore complex protein NUP160 [Selaginella moellendorffii]|uniref:nuclear pore complex protein NUP160 n=1 Tax=Selaginella moellendorffii TaxID=88036 RepID=UPI000D1C87A9|nr:nuclear pore complex protein NUP160 [Selaginella moellendorffii]|eukprot:XP_024542730.1 nuclear pore complex protein NUP160 [Selaginella moellendorffii]
MEVPLVGSEATRWTNVGVPGPRLPPAVSCCCPAPINAAGAALVPSATSKARDCFIIWRIHQSSPSAMEIVQFSPQQDFPGYGLRLLFSEALCPFAGIFPIEVNNGQGLNFTITIVAASGIVYVVKLPVAMELWSNFVLSNSTLMVRDLSSEFTRLHEVTSFTAARNILFVGGRNGSVLCFSLFTDLAQDICYELKGGDAGIGRLWGLVSRNKSAASVKSLAVQEIHNKHVLLVLHEDGTLQAWDPLQHFRLFSHNICPSPELTGSSASQMWTEDGVFAASKQLAVLFTEASLTKTRSTICIYTMDPQPSSGLQLGMPTLQQVIPVEQGVVVDVMLVQGSLWILTHNTVDSDLMHLKLQLGVLPQHSVLQETELDEQLVIGDGDNLPFLPTEGTITEILIRRLLQPGFFHHETAQQVLQGRGVIVNDSSLRTSVEEDWRRDISLAIKITDEAKQFEQRNNFVTEYARAWKKNHSPYVLLADATTGCVGLVRKSSLSLIRSQSSVERTTWRNDSEVLKRFMSCVHLVITHIGELPLAVFDESLLQRKGASIDQLVATCVHNLDVGSQPRQDLSIGVDGLREKEKVRHTKQRLFNFKICQELLAIKDVAGNWSSVLDSIANYERCLLFGSTQKSCEIPPMGNAFTKLITQATSQVLWAHYQECRNLVLLLSYVINMKSQVNLTGSEASRIQLQILPRLKKAMLINLLLYWLTVTPGEAPDSDDFNSLLASLRLDGAANTAWKGGLGFGQFTLAEILGASFFEAAPVTFRNHSGAFVEKGDLLDYARGFITWLSVGQDSRLNFPRRIIDLSVILLKHGQYRGLESLLSIVERHSNEQTFLDDVFAADGECSARLHLLGFCRLARACSGNGSNKSQEIKDAASCFFRAAATLGDSDERFHSLFRGKSLLPESTAAAWKLQYFEWVMQIFEQHNLSEGASQFALAALDQVDQAGSDRNTIGTKGRLWANVFKFSMDLELYGEAYTAIVSNPDEEVKLTCLRRFVVVLCERKATQILCGGDLPYAGLLDTVEQELAWKAEYSDVSAKPNVYKLLYAFSLHHHNYRRAAGYMYRYAARMRDEGVSKSRLQVAVAFQEQVNGLAAAINTLSLVSPSSAWIDLQFTIADEKSSSSPSKRPRLAGTGVVNYVAVVKEENVVDIEELDKQYVLAVAKLELVQASIKHPTIGELSPSEVVHLLVQYGLYESAFSTLFRLWKGSVLKRELEKTFELIARNCCSQQTSLRPPNGKLLMLTGVDSTDGELPAASKGDWQSLQRNLEKYRPVHPRLPVVVAETIISVNKNMELPLWLTDLLKGGKSVNPFGMAGQDGDPAALLRIYVDNGRLVEASTLILDYLRAWANMRPTDVIKRKKVSAAWFPYALIDRLQQSLAEVSDRDSRCKEMKSSLQAALKRHLSQMKDDSNDIISSQA